MIDFKMDASGMYFATIIMVLFICFIIISVVFIVSFKINMTKQFLNLIDRIDGIEKIILKELKNFINQKNKL